MKLTREFFKPQNAILIGGNLPLKIECYQYETRKGQLAGMFFAGNGAKPTQHFSYKNVDDLLIAAAKFIQHYKNRNQEKLQRKAEGKVEAQKFYDGIKKGDIFYTSWGYDQTNIEFFEILEKKPGRKVVLQELAASREETEWMQGNKTPTACLIGEPSNHIITRSGSIKIDNVRNAWPHDGKPKRYSSYA